MNEEDEGLEMENAKKRISQEVRNSESALEQYPEGEGTEIVLFDVKAHQPTETPKHLRLLAVRRELEYWRMQMQARRRRHG